MEINDIIRDYGHLVPLFFILLFSLCFHEFAHGWMAKRRGDNTAETMGRLTLNPMAHIDWIGTVILPIFSLISQIPLFGWAKPVPVNERNLAKPREDMFWIAFAGPLSNIILALIGAVLMLFLVAFGNQVEAFSSMRQIVYVFVSVNFLLAFFNMIPLHPLDGGKVLARFLPPKVNMALENGQQYSGMILIIAFVSGAFSYIAIPVHWATQNILGIAYSVGNLLNS